MKHNNVKKIILSNISSTYSCCAIFIINLQHSFKIGLTIATPSYALHQIIMRDAWTYINHFGVRRCLIKVKLGIAYYL